MRFQINIQGGLHSNIPSTRRIRNHYNIETVKFTDWNTTREINTQWHYSVNLVLK